jgi:AcrR family transcriptional regulator
MFAVTASEGAPPNRRKRRILGLDHQQRQEQRRTLLLDAALELFGTRGYAKTSIELLCQTAGIGTNSFYELFPNKEAVLVGLYDQISKVLRDAIADEYLAHQHHHDLIWALVSRFVHETLDDPRIARVAFIESAGVSAKVEEHRRQTRNDFIDGLQAIGREIRSANHAPARADERIRPGPGPRRNAVALVGAIIEMTLDWLLEPAPDPIGDLIDDIARHCQRIVDAIVEETAAPPPPVKGRSTTSSTAR